MVRLIMYLLESSALLACFYLLFILVLQKETFFSLNRFYLISILVFSLLFPLVRYDFAPLQVQAIERPIAEVSKMRHSYYEALAIWEYEVYRGASNNSAKVVPENMVGASATKVMINLLLAIYAIGIVVFMSRLLWVFQGLWKMVSTNRNIEMDGVLVVLMPQPIAPFSFLKYVIVHEGLYNSPAFGQVLAHEKTHIQQKHSIDLIFVQLLAALLWFNPVVWQLIKSLKTTHEYIADRKIIRSGYSLVEYQTLLLKQLISNNPFGLVHNFNLSFIKKRITMMKNKQSGWTGKVKVAMTIATTVLFGALIVQCNSKMEEQLSMDGTQQAKSGDGLAIELPTVAHTGNAFSYDPSDLLVFTIAKNELTVDGKKYTLAEIVPLIERAGLSEQGTIALQIDKNQTMDFVKDVQTELRKANKRKILYQVQSPSKQVLEIPLLLPPTLEHAKEGTPMQPSMASIEAEGKMEILKIDVGKKYGVATQQKVYEFVKSHIDRQSMDYVVSVRNVDEDLFSNYITDLSSVMGGFDQIYQERAQQMFGKDFYSLDKDEYSAVRKGIPKAISIAE